MSEKVPWTDPGGTPCCCEEDCFTDFANEPKPIYADNSFADISAQDYTALYAGGIYTASIVANIVAARDNTNVTDVFTDTETHTINQSGIALTPSETDAPCYLSALSSGLTVDVERINRFGTFQNTYESQIRFIRSLGTESGGRKISLASVQGPSAVGSVTSLFSFSGVSQTIFPNTVIRAGNMTDTVPLGTCAGGTSGFFEALPQASAAISLQVGGNTYTAINPVLHSCFVTVNHYNQVIKGQAITSFGFQLFASITGSVSIDATFTPSAP